MNILNWTIENILSALTIFLAIIGGFFAYHQWQHSNNIQRANFINQIIEKLRFDKDMATALYLIDYNKNWYNENFHGGGDEFLIDKLLSYLSYICYLIDTDNISKIESKILEYELTRVCESHAVQAYLWNLNCFSKNRKSECSFQYLINYGIKHNIINKSFLLLECKDFPKYLNF